MPKIHFLERHTQLVRQLHHVLKHEKIVTASEDDETFTRTSVAIATSPAESLYHEIVDKHPQHAVVIKLIRAVGSKMAACLRGDLDPIQVLFGDPETKQLLGEMYEFWPLLRTPALVLGDFLTKALASKQRGDGKFRILEIGAGTGGTTRYLVDRLRKMGVEFEYTITDLGASLASSTLKRFEDKEGLAFDRLDVEQPVKQEYLGAFHCIVATNCIHATKDLEVSLGHARQMLRDDGVLALIEITENMFWLDIVVGLLEGWWRFEDGRTHALIDEKAWERKMKAAGFRDVLWSDGATPESKTVRVVAAFPGSRQTVSERKVKAAMETVVYKRVGDLDIHADVYYPAADQQLVERKMPVGR